MQCVILNEKVKINKLDYKATEVLPSGSLLLTRTAVSDNEMQALHQVRLDRKHVLKCLHTQLQEQVEANEKLVQVIQKVLTMFLILTTCVLFISEGSYIIYYFCHCRVTTLMISWDQQF